MGGLTFLQPERRKVRQALIDIDAGRAPQRGRGLRTAIHLGWVHVDRTGRKDEAEVMLTSEGLALARSWRDNDSHAGNAS